MAKSKSNSDKQRRKDTMSAAVREMIAQHPRAKSKEIVKMLADKGVTVRPTLVYYIRSSDKKRKRRAKREKAVETSQRNGTANPVALILKVKELAAEAGGMRKLKQLVDVLAE